MTQAYDARRKAVVSEFERSPENQCKNCCDHCVHCSTTLLAGGGVLGRAIDGASNALGRHVKDHPVTPEDCAATILHAFGFSRAIRSPGFQVEHFTCDDANALGRYESWQTLMWHFHGRTR